MKEIVKEFTVQEMKSIRNDVYHNRTHEKYDKEYIKHQDINTLVKSIQENGQQTPGAVNKVGNKYILINGHRRFFACRLMSIPFRAIVYTGLSDKECRIMAYNANKMTKQLTSFEHLLEVISISNACGIKKAAIHIGLSVSSVTLYRLIGAITCFRTGIKRGILKLGTAQFLVQTMGMDKLRIIDKEYRQELYELIKLTSKGGATVNMFKDALHFIATDNMSPKDAIEKAKRQTSSVTGDIFKMNQIKLNTKSTLITRMVRATKDMEKGLKTLNKIIEKRKADA